MDLSKRSNPQKHCLKIICNIIFYFGCGECWYERRSQTQFKKICYQIWRMISNVYIFSFILNEYLAHLRSDLDEKEKNDLVQFTFAHSSIVAKIIIAYFEKKRIVKVLERLLEGSRTIYISEDLDKACIKRCVKICGALICCSYIAILASTIDGVREYLIEGVPIRTEVTLYPTTSESGIAVNVLRFFIQFHWWFCVAIMAAIDCLCICSLVIVGYKFKVYFNNMREKVLSKVSLKTKKEVEEEFKKDFVVGMKLHEDALWCAKHVQNALGHLYSVQIFECVALVVMSLIKLVTVQRSLVFLMANFTFIGCSLLLTGAYMMPAGDITFEASAVPTCIFQCGWEQIGGRAGLLAVLALQRGQVPVVMYAFGIYELSYANFISVIRMSYSFFAVKY